MTNRRGLILNLALVAILFLYAYVHGASHGDDRERRDPKQVAAFRKVNPCPATGKTSGACDGYVIDHIVPISLCGPDRPDNMQWQKIEDARRKDALEFEAYWAKRRGEEALKVKVLCTSKVKPTQREMEEFRREWNAFQTPDAPTEIEVK